MSMGCKPYKTCDPTPELQCAAGSGIPPTTREVATWQRARELGVTKIVSRNEFSSRTRELVEEILQYPAGTTPPPSNP